MATLLLFIISAAFLWFFVQWVIIKKDLPAFMHRALYDSRRMNEVRDQGKPAGFSLYQFGFLIWSGIACGFLIYLLTPDSGRPGIGLFIGFGLWIFSILRYGKVEKGLFRQKVETGKQEDQAAINAAAGAKNWATDQEIEKVIRDSAAPDGSPVGIHIGEGWHWNEKGHMLTVGGSGQGKGVNLILPAILSDYFVAGGGISLVCLDPKGENAAIAAPFLKRSGYDVHIINPFGIAEISDLGNSRFNPFDMIDADSDEATRLYDVLAMSLHNRRDTGGSSFFDNRCRQYISLYMAYAHHAKMGNFDTVYDWLISSGDRREKLLESMVADSTFDQAKTAQAILDRLTGDAAKTEENIYGTIEEAIDILKNKQLRASLAASDFDMRTVAKKPTAIFLCVPFEDLDYYAPWVRMVFNFLLRTLTKHYDINRKVLVLLDEFPQLSYMDEVPRSAAVLRGYNVTLWPVVQSLGQLKTIYKDNWEIFINSSVVKHWLSSGTDNTTADYIEKRMPVALRFLGENADGSPKYTEGKLMSSSDAMGFEHMICELSKLDRPIKFKKIPYWDLPFAKDNASDNPFYKNNNK